MKEVKLQTPGELIIITQCFYLLNIFGIPGDVLENCINNVSNSGNIKAYTTAPALMLPRQSIWSQVLYNTHTHTPTCTKILQMLHLRHINQHNVNKIIS